jgi:hypothetical protein
MASGGRKHRDWENNQHIAPHSHTAASTPGQPRRCAYSGTICVSSFWKFASPDIHLHGLAANIEIVHLLWEYEIVAWYSVVEEKYKYQVQSRIITPLILITLAYISIRYHLRKKLPFQLSNTYFNTIKMRTVTVLFALVAAAFAAPTNVEEPTLAKRGCAAGDICISGSCYQWICGPVGCSVGGNLGGSC